MAQQQWETYFDAVRKEDWKSARNILQLISKQDRNNPQTFMKLGDVCQRSGDKSAAIAAYTHAAQLLRMQGFAQKALATYKIALRLDPDNPEIISRAEILMDEFEAAKTAPHMPVIPASSPTPAVEAAEELLPPPEEAAPASAEVPRTSDWLERTAVSSDASSEEERAAPEIAASDMTSLFESTSLTTETPRTYDEPSARSELPVDASETDMPIELTSEPPQAVNRPELPAAADSAVPAEETSFDVTGIPQIEVPASEPAQADDEDGEWLESAYEALDTRMFKPEAERSSGATTARGDDAIKLVSGQKPAKQDEELAEAMQELLIPLSERRDRSIPEIFEDMPEDMINSFMDGLTIRKYRNKEHVIEEGDAGDSMYIVRSGRARVIAHMLGRELELAVLGDGDVFGEVGFLTGRPRTASVIADGPVEVYEISRLDIEKLIETSPDIMAKIEDFYELRVRDTIKKIKN